MEKETGCSSVTLFNTTNKTFHVNMRDGSGNQFETIGKLLCWASWRPTTVYMSTQVEKTLKTLITN